MPAKGPLGSGVWSAISATFATTTKGIIAQSVVVFGQAVIDSFGRIFTSHAGSVGGVALGLGAQPDTGFYFPTTSQIAAALTGVQAILMSAPADTETVLSIRRNVGGVFTVSRVSMGAVDSGGAGFKVLRVPNT